MGESNVMEDTPMTREELDITKEERDELGEIANISIGNAATTLSLMVNHTVTITTPNITIVNRS
ncbi:MAG: chemotaxis protein CheC, partial [Lachnospiraceae bacterium]|nr:chemotaxis protein CheC [Lachnospiraceae bacterium]